MRCIECSKHMGYRIHWGDEVVYAAPYSRYCCSNVCYLSWAYFTLRGSRPPLEWSSPTPPALIDLPWRYFWQPDLLGERLYRFV